jgi:hypothetical protein
MRSNEGLDEKANAIATTLNSTEIARHIVAFVAAPPI